MQFFCDGEDGKTWFRIDTAAEAERESQDMRHAVERYFVREAEAARETYAPQGLAFIERDIGLKAHIQKTMPVFLTLRSDDGEGFATAMLPPGPRPQAGFRIIIVGPENADPYPAHAGAIARLAAHIGQSLPRSACFPYARASD